MDNKHNIRNISVIADVDHGKSTLISSLVDTFGITAQEVGNNVQSGIYLYHEMTDAALKNLKGEYKGNKHLINLIDSPRHVDVSSEVNSDLRIIDGALVVVDYTKGVSVQTESVLRQALKERIRPVLTINKIDLCFSLKVDGEEAYQRFQQVIESVNDIISTHEDPLLGDVMVYPKKGTVAFSTGIHGWAFTLNHFAKLYAFKFDIDEAKMMEMLWGDNFYDPKTNEWTTKNTGSESCKRGFVQYVYEPVRQIIDMCMNDRQKDVLWPCLKKLGVFIRSEDKKRLTGMALMKCVMQKWLPAVNLLEMMLLHLPSASVAQRYRIENLYEGPSDDVYANAIRNCDPNGPLMFYVSKVIPASNESGRFFAFGRVFSGKVSPGMKVRIMGPNYVPGETSDLNVRSVHRTLVWMGRTQVTLLDVPCGNTVALVGLNQFVTKNAVLTNVEEVEGADE